MTGPNPVDRGKTGSKIHVLSDRGGLPLSVAVSAANTNDAYALKPLVMAIPAITSRRGPRRRKPDKLHADKTSHAPWLSGGGLGRGVAGGGEGGVFVVALSGAQAVVQDADEPVEQVALGGDVPVSGVLAAVVVGSGAG